MSAAAVTGLVFLVISTLVRYDFSVKVIWNDARQAYGALKEKYGYRINSLIGVQLHEKYYNLWFRTSRSETGVTVYKPEKSAGGLTFYSSHTPGAYLIDMEGNVVHEWHKPFEEVWPEPEHILEKGIAIYWRRAHLFPNGDILAIYEGINQAPYGGGIIKLDRDSNLLWKVDINAHHDLDVLEDGSVLVLYHQYSRSLIKEENNVIIADGIAFISHDGREVRKWPLVLRVYESQYSDLFDWSEADSLHTNNIETLSTSLAPRFPMFEAGDILVSMNMASVVMVLDHGDLRPKWAFHGMTDWQHDPDFQENGTIRLLDNNGCRVPDTGGSRILDVNPIDNRVVWEYNGTPEEPFYTLNRGSQQTLEGGNILITESTGGRIFEITPSGEIVWEYVNPDLQGDSIPLVNWALRYKRENLTFLDEK